MEEIVKHGLGMCGENHPHLLNISAVFVAFVGYLSYIKFKIKSIWNNNKN